jgi:hypothetical protein
MRRKLSQEEKLWIQAERYLAERADFPDADIGVIVEDYTYPDGTPIIRVVRFAGEDGPAGAPHS